MPDFLKTLSPAICLELNALLEKAIALDDANMGDLQVYDESTEILHLIAQKGFDDDFINYFKEVKAFSSATCGRAIGIGASALVS